MSLHRRQSRARLIANRANTLPPLLQENGSPGMSICSPSIEESLQDWLSRSRTGSDSPTAWLTDASCPCCGEPGCDRYESIAQTVKKLEGDARLAAEIGQSLLHKHESFVVESNQVKQVLEEELEESREKNRQLEQLLEEAEAAKEELMEQKNKSTWEWQKTQKTLQETAADLEAANARCLQLANDLKKETMEVDKLRVFKFMARQADIREETLKSKLEDTKQELAIARKAELALESKHKKLKARYEAMLSKYEKLRSEQQEHGISSDRHVNLEWLKESNEKLRMDVLKLTSSMVAPPASLNDGDDMQQQQEQQQQEQQQANHPQPLIALIKELASANHKLKNDLLDCRELLSETRHEVITLNCRLEDLERNHPSAAEEIEENRDWAQPQKQQQKGASETEDTNQLLSISAPQDGGGGAADTAHHPWRVRSKPGKPRVRRATISTRRVDSLRPSPTISSSMPTSQEPASIIHHHYHYHLQQQQLQAMAGPSEPDASSSKDKQPSRNDQNSVSSSTTAEETPLHQLRTQVAETLERLRATDIRALNRRLRRAFDILELSTMSNSIIESILVDVETLALPADVGGQEDMDAMVRVIQDMLSEIGQLRITMNDLQVEYVKKVKQIDERAEEEVLRKRESRKKPSSEPAPSSGALGWLTSVFQRTQPSPPASSNKPPPPPPPPPVEKLLAYSDPAKPIRPLNNTGPPHPVVSQPRPIPMLRNTRNTAVAGKSVRRVKSLQAPALEYAAAVKRKKSNYTLRLSDFDVPSVSPEFDADWKVSGAFGATSWLGNK